MNIDDIVQRGLRRYLERCDCAATTCAICRYIIRNDTTQFRLRCEKCQHLSLSSIPHALLTDNEKQAAPVLRAAPPPPCERCSSTEGSEIHHWAPREMFTDSFAWPTAWLCRRCHMEWHRMVNEYQRRRQEPPKQP
jgi:hypothetical protein